jgi:hypothetical protein
MAKEKSFIKKVFTAVPAIASGAITGFMVGGGPWGALAGGVIGLGTSLSAQSDEEKAEEALKTAEANLAAGIVKVSSLETAFTNLQLEKLATAYNTTKEDLKVRLRTDPALIAQSFRNLESTLDPEITDRYRDDIADLEELLQTGSAQNIAELKKSFVEVNSKMTEADRVLASSFDYSTETLNDGIKRLQDKYGDVSQILAGVSQGSEKIISENSDIARQAYQSGAVQTAVTLGKGQDTAIQALKTGQEQSVGALTGAQQTATQALTQGQTQANQSLGQGLASATGALQQGQGQANRALNQGLGQATGALQQGLTTASDISTQATGQQLAIGQTGLREALGQGQPFQQAGTAGLQSFADTALSPDSALFKRNLSIAQENLNQELASRGLLNSGAAIASQSKLIQDMTEKEIVRQTGLQQTLAQMGLQQTGNQQQLIADQTRSDVQAIATSAGLRAGLEQATATQIASNAVDTAKTKAGVVQGTAQDIARQYGNVAQQYSQNAQQTAQNLSNVATGTAQNVAQQYGSSAEQQANVIGQTAQAQAGYQSQVSRDLAELSKYNTEQKVQILKAMGMADANFQAQSAQDIIQIDSILANTAIQNGVSRGELSMQTANNLMNQAGQTSNLLGTLNNQVATLREAGINNATQQEINRQNQLLNTRTAGTTLATQAELGIQDRLSALPLDQFENNYNIGRTSQTALQNIEAGNMNMQQNQAMLRAQQENASADRTMAGFNSMLGAAGTFAGSSQGQSFIGGLSNKGNGGNVGGGTMTSTVPAGQGLSSYNPSTSLSRTPTSTYTPNYNLSGRTQSQAQPTFTNTYQTRQPTTSSSGMNFGFGKATADTTQPVADLMGSQSGFRQYLEQPVAQALPSDTRVGAGFSMEQQNYYDNPQVAQLDYAMSNPYSGNQMPRRQPVQGFRNYLSMRG